MSVRACAAALSLLAVSACASGGVSGAPSPATSVDTQSDDIRPFTPGDEEPLIARGPNRAATADELVDESRLARLLADPKRSVRLHYRSGVAPQNAIVGGNGESVGMWVNQNFTAEGSVVNMGVQPNYVVSNGGNFFHTHQFVPNACIEYGINYSAYDPYLFAYNWCTGGNTPQGWISKGLLSQPGGILNTWQATGNGALLAWDSRMGTYKIAVEEILRSDGWHMLGYDWTTKKFVDIMDGYGVTGQSQSGGGWAVMEEHNAVGARCNFDAAFPVGTHLLYDAKKQAFSDGAWHQLDTLPAAGLTDNLQMDCVNLGTSLVDDVSPYFSGEYFPSAAIGRFGKEYAGSFWLTQR